MNKHSEYLLINVPGCLNFSSSIVRNLIKKEQFKEALKFIDVEVLNYILSNNLYKNWEVYFKSEKFEKIVQKLIKNKKTIATMESCTGGSLASAITNVEGASAVFKFGAVTYSNDFKIKMGVNKKTIDEYSVYSINTAREMAFSISRYAIADIGVELQARWE